MYRFCGVEKWRPVVYGTVKSSFTRKGGISSTEAPAGAVGEAPTEAVAVALLT